MLEDIRYAALIICAMLGAWAFAQWADHRDARRDECRAYGMRWDSTRDKCVPRREPPPPPMARTTPTPFITTESA